MSAAIGNTTQKSCNICLEDYVRDEIKDTEKVVEVVCGHFFHTRCIGEWNKEQENSNLPLKCGYCNQIYATPAHGNFEIFSNKTLFTRLLNTIKETYSYDSIAVNAALQVEKLFDELSALQQHIHHTESEIEITPLEFQEQMVENIRDFIVNSQAIPKNLKGNVLMVISAMLTSDGCLRSLTGESRRWRGVPFDQLPEKIRREGCLVRMNGFKVRISANYLLRSAAKVHVDDVVDKLRMDSDAINAKVNAAIGYIGSIPGNTVRRLYNFASSIFGYFTTEQQT